MLSPFGTYIAYKEELRLKFMLNASLIPGGHKQKN
jgi:hypothetical protein